MSAWGAAVLAGTAALIITGRGPGRFATGADLSSFARRVRDRLGRGRREATSRAAVVELVRSLAAELAAGRTPEQAWVAAVESAGRDLAAQLAPVSAALAAGQDAAACLDSVASRAPPLEGLRSLAACWRLAAESGASLKTALAEIADALRDDIRLAEEVAAQLAAPRSTMRLLAGLPLFGLFLGSAMGADPIHFLLATPGGAVCLLVAGGLEWAGLAWSRRLLRVALSPPGARSPAAQATPPRVERWRAPAVAVLALGAFAVVGGWLGAVLAVLLGAAAWRGMRWAASPSARTDNAVEWSLIAELPLALDLVRAGLAAGAMPSAAVTAAGRAVRGPLSERLLDVGALLRLHAPAASAWAAWLREPCLAPAARALVRSGESGAPLGEVLARLAADGRDAARARAEAAVRRLGVRAVVPLGVCFLPAFVLVGVVPIVVGLARTALV